MPISTVTASDAHGLEHIADFLGKSKKILVVTGAGISTSCGIPDFRSKEGIYSLIQEQYSLEYASSSTPPPLRNDLSTPMTDFSSSQASSSSIPQSTLEKSSKGRNTGEITSSNPSSTPKTSPKGKDLFDANIWKNPQETKTFYEFITAFRLQVLGIEEASPTHKFIRALRDGGRLLRCYTQNIDGLEDREGLCSELSRGKGNNRRLMKKVVDKPRPSTPIPAGDEMDGGCEVVQIHGDLKGLRCVLCNQKFPWEGDGLVEMMLAGEAPACPSCKAKKDERKANQKRGTAVGVLRPNIVLYGEEHPHNDQVAPILENDLRQKPDTLVVMGTSMKVHGFQNLVKQCAKSVHASGNGKVIFVNRTKVSEATWKDVIDYHVEMNTDDWVSDLKQRKESLWLRQGELKVQVVKRASKRKADDAEVNGDSSKPAKKSKSNLKEDVGEGSSKPGANAVKTAIAPKKAVKVADAPSVTASTFKKAPKRKAQDADQEHESPMEPRTPENASWRPKKKFRPSLNSSFKPVSDDRPPSYRTPSPPVDARSLVGHSVFTPAPMNASFTSTSDAPSPEYGSSSSSHRDVLEPFLMDPAEERRAIISLLAALKNPALPVVCSSADPHGQLLTPPPSRDKTSKKRGLEEILNE